MSVSIIREHNRLVRYEIYPVSAPVKLKALFRHYDRSFAAALGVELYGDDEEGYDIAIILSQDWWDDGHWHFDSCARCLHFPLIRQCFEPSAISYAPASFQ